MVVGCAADEHYAMPMAVMLESAVASLAPDRRLLVYVVDVGIAPESRSKVLASLRSERVTVHWLLPDEQSFSEMPLWGRMRLATYQRLAIADRLADHAKVIWLDCDLVVRKDLAKLWDLDLDDRHLLAAQDMVVPYVSSRYGVAPYERLGIRHDVKYFNAGVMLVNLDLWRTTGVAARVIAYLSEHAKSTVFWDQEGLNAVLVGRWGELDPRWNQMAAVCGRRFYHPRHLGEREYRRVVEDPWIVHYGGTLKPWVCRGSSAVSSLFFQHLDRTAWAGWRPRVTFKSLALGTYESRLRTWLYPVESWGMEFLRRRTLRSRRSGLDQIIDTP